MSPRLLQLAATLIVAAFALSLTLGQFGCAGENCLEDGENCSQAFLEENNLLDHHCCNGQTCREGPTSGVLICRF